MEMKIILNIKILVNDDSTIGLTNESLAILALLKYCDLSVNTHLACVCYYTQGDLEQINLGVNQLENQLNEVIPYFRFIQNDEEAKINCIEIKNLNLRTNEDYLNDTTLPSLVSFASEDCYMVTTGLSSVYRFIIKYANKIKPSMKTQNLLVINLF